LKVKITIRKTKMLHTTLKLCKENYACPKGFENLKSSLGKGHSATDLIPLTHVIKSNGLHDAIWAFKATVENSDYLAREFAIFCARQVLHIYEAKYPDDSRLRDCIDAAERYNNKEITLDELGVFRNAALTVKRYAATEAAMVEDATAEAAAESARATLWSAANSARIAASKAAEAAYWAAYWTSEDTKHTAEYAARNEQALKLIELLHNHKEN
jgi:hypothetical protein